MARSGLYRRIAKAVAGAAAGALILSACGSAGSASSSSGSSGAATNGGTATYAFGANYFKWIFPLPNEVSWTEYQQAVEYALWAPLYQTGVGTQPIVNEPQSIAYAPIFSNNNSVVTINLKPGWKWSDGTPVTTKDIQFFFQLFDANKSSVASYVPGNFPDNITSVDYVSPTQFVIHLNGSYSQQWVADNELTNIIPLPAQTWDRTSMTGPVGDNASTTAGAKAVFNFLTKQSETLSTYGSNPLWKTVDGAWTLTSYDPTTSRVVLTANPKYTGPGKPHLHQVIIDSYASDTAEVDALRSGSLDYGFLPYSDYLGLKGYFQSHGYTVAPWIPDFVEWGVVNYTGPYAALDSQLYIRQALQHVINQELYIKTILHGIGVQTYGPVPNSPGSPFISPQEKVDPYPYSTSAAKSLLTSHGWAPGANGVMTCQSPGTGSNQCGAGITQGQQLTLSLLYVNSSPTLTAQVQAFQTAAKAAGINITLNPQSETSVYTLGGLCPTSAPCNWAIKLFPNWLWNYGDLGTYPTGGQQWGTGNYWGGGYSSQQADALIKATHTQSGTAALFQYQNYISQQVAALWFPTWATQISVVKNTLHGWQPQQVFGFPNWNSWSIS
ncbi:MAG: ABC transporter substrate-binding protein [Actinomycetota bacterium]|nr:ABC transporter substrate-binding protein [Actinomycetota bacterium]